MNSFYTRVIIITRNKMSTTQNNSVQVAKTIHQQLIGLGKIKVWSWGANSWSAISNGLMFKVQGFKFKGIVKIILVPNDTYRIEFVKANNTVKEFTDVYFDEMVGLIDNYVEYTGANYSSDIKKSLYIL